MRSRWFQLKSGALELRQKGNSIGRIEKTLGIPKSTLSGWFKHIYLTRKQKNRLEIMRKNALAKARVKAISWHHEQKHLRLLEAENKAKIILNKLDFKNPNILYLALAILYLGEGLKKTAMTALGNSDPLILKFFISTLKKPII